MFEEYKRSLRDFYLLKKEKRLLTTNLEKLQRDRLRAECASVFLRKRLRVDQDLIRSVFDPTNEHEDQMRSIERFDLDKFRPLITFLTIGTNIRDDNHVKLFAWLIDFPTYDEWCEFSKEELKHFFQQVANGKKIEKDRKGHGGGKKGRDNTNQDSTRLIPSSYIIISCIILLFMGSISFIAWERMATKARMPKAGEKHMYWDGDHYEPVEEGDQKPGVSIIPLDLKTLRQQRKITIPDTLTKYSLGKVWYKGHGRNHEFFTAAGLYPPDTLRTLKPLSLGILRDHTSNYRYMLTRLIWFLYAAFLISLSGYGVSRIKRKVTVDNQEQNINDHIADFSETQLAQQ